MEKSSQRKEAKWHMLFYFKNILCVWVFSFMYACVQCMCLVPAKVRRRCQISQEWRCRGLWAAMWVVGTELRSSVRAIGTLNHWAMSSASHFYFQHLGCAYLLGKKWHYDLKIQYEYSNQTNNILDNYFLWREYWRLLSLQLWCLQYTVIINCIHHAVQYI